MTTTTHKTLTDVNARQDMNLPKLIQLFGTEDLCRDYLKHLRWPEGPACIRCGSKSLSWISTRHQFDCNTCRKRFSVTAGTVLHDSHLPLSKWFLAVYMLCESKKGMSANQLKRTLAISYPTAWFLCHRIRWAMHEATPAMLRGTVEADETYIGGKRRGHGVKGGWDNKTMVLGALERGGNVRLRVETRGPKSHVTKSLAHQFLTAVVADEAEAIYTDQNQSYHGIGDENTRHESVDHSKEEWVRGDVTTNGIESSWSLLKRSIVGSYHQLSTKHLPAYLDEFAFRFNNRENPFLFRDTLKKLLSAEALSYEMLTGAE